MKNNVYIKSLDYENIEDSFIEIYDLLKKHQIDQLKDAVNNLTYKQYTDMLKYFIDIGCHQATIHCIEVWRKK